MQSGSKKSYQKISINVGLILLSVLITFAAGETYLRLFRVRVITLDDELGWIPTPGYSYSGYQESIDGSQYFTNVSQDDQGFRSFGRLGSDRPKLFVIGDSMTQAIQASDDKTYYALVGQYLNVDIFAYGLSGAGTLQEYMILDSYFEEISPDLVLWQFCPSDFINNSYELEIQTRQNYNGMVRPYLENGQIVYRLPLPYPKAALFLIQHSQLFRFIFGKIYTLQANQPDSIEAEIMKLGFEHEGFQRSYQITDRIIAQAKQRFGRVPIFAFNCSYAQPFHEAFKTISADHDIHFIDMDVITEGQKRDQIVLAGDGGHWNEAGHALAAETISRYLDAVLPCLKNGQPCRIEVSATN